jgi:hypothetical protein
VFIGYLALEQLGAAGTIDTLNRISEAFGGATTSVGDLRLTAGLNGLFALLTLYFGIKLLRHPTRGFLQTSMAWAVLNAIWNGYSIANGVTNGAYLGATIAAIAAGAFSFVAWSRTPSKP